MVAITDQGEPRSDNAGLLKELPSNSEERTYCEALHRSPGKEDSTGGGGATLETQQGWGEALNSVKSCPYAWWC
jgi:hypothetical protein